MTDNEIIKALKCCWHEKECIGDECPLFKPINDCAPLIAMEALDLINRQKAEMERLEAMVDAAEDYLNPLPFRNKFNEYVENAKAEAVKEFAEAVKMQFYREFDEIIPSIMADAIDTLVKEFTEGEKV